MNAANRHQRQRLTRLWKTTIGVIFLMLSLLLNAQTPPAQSSDKEGMTTGPPQSKPAISKKPPQAKTQVEFDAYQKIAQATDPKQKMELADKFVADFPDSELKGVAYQQGLVGAQMNNDYEKAVDYARKVLKESPDHVLALLILASWIPERTVENDPQRDAKLAEATEAAKKLLEAVSTLQKPTGTSEDQWRSEMNELNARPHAALGFISLQKKDYATSQQEYEKAVSYLPNEATFFYRLGLAYTYEKKYDQAAWYLARSVSLKGVSEKPARDALDSLFKAYGEDPVKAGVSDLTKMAGDQPKMPEGFSFMKFMETKLNAKSSAASGN